MDTTKPPRGFTTAILHSDRDGGIEHGALHKPLHVSVAYGYRDARDLAAVFQGRAQGYAYGRQGNPTTAALESKVTKMEDGVATVCFATGMAAIGALMLALLREGDHVVVSQFLFGNTVSQFNTLRGARREHHVRRCDRRRQCRAGADACDEAHLRRDDRQPAHADRGSRPDRRACQGARHSLRRRQHDDLARAVPAEDGARGDRDQCVDEIHRRAWQRARRQHHGHRRLFDWNALSQHRGELQVAAARAVGNAADPQERAARLRRDALRRRRASHRGRRRDARAADGAHVRERTGARRISRLASAGWQGVLPGIGVASRSTSSRARSFAASAGSSRSSSRTASTASISSIASTSSCRRRIWATTGRSRYRSRTRSSGKWGRPAARKWASPTASFASRSESRTATI